eukprot:4660162-Prymnesium_polylepis.1
MQRVMRKHVEENLQARTELTRLKETNSQLNQIGSPLGGADAYGRPLALERVAPLFTEPACFPGASQSPTAAQLPMQQVAPAPQ